MQGMLFLNFIMPLVMVLVGAILKKYPVSDINRQTGYDSPAARKSQAHWDYAQKIAPGIFIFSGKCLFIAEAVVCVILWMLQVSIGNALMIGMCIGFAFLFYAFYYTEKRINLTIGN